MKRDSDGLMISETSPWPGSIGDSCANTARSALLTGTEFNYTLLVTDAGFLRHPTAPDGWREDDFSGDQLLPLFMAVPVLRERIRREFPARSGNGAFHTPLTWAIIHDHPWLANIFLWLQLALFHLPYRWSDRDGLKWYQRLERMDSSSADYLNWFCACVYLKRRAELSISVPIDEVSHKVFDYYSNEPNNVEILQDYECGFGLFE